jgi:glycosyltransferase involved in cell wall biosynthesis
METKKGRSVCILTTSKVATDQRILKQIHTFQKMSLHVVAIGYGSCNDDLIDELQYHTLSDSVSIQLTFLRRLIRLIREPRRFFSYFTQKFRTILSKILLLSGRIIPQAYILVYWLNDDHVKLKDIAAFSKCDFFHANDIMVLPAALAASSGAPVVFDAHEYAPGQLHLKWRERHIINPYHGFLCRYYIPRVTKMTTVCDSIAKLYAKETGVVLTVIRNVPPYQKMRYHSTNPKQIRLIHHGGATPERFLEDMIRLVALLPIQYTLTFMLTMPSSRNTAYLDKLRNIAEDTAPGRVTFTQAVAYTRLIQILNTFDIGVYILRGDRNINCRYALPNKLFEFIMAGLCIAINPSFEMAKIVNKYHCGIIADDDSPRTLAEAICRMSPKDINQYKKNSLSAAKELNADIEMKKLITIYDELLETKFA